MLWQVTVQLRLWRSSEWSSAKAERIAIPMKKTKYYASRRATPWDLGECDHVQQFIKNEYLSDYYEKHRSLSEAGEASLLNGFEPVGCPYCGSGHFIRKGG